MPCTGLMFETSNMAGGQGRHPDPSCSFPVIASLDDSIRRCFWALMCSGAATFFPSLALPAPGPALAGFFLNPQNAKFMSTVFEFSNPPLGCEEGL